MTLLIDGDIINLSTIVDYRKGYDYMVLLLLSVFITLLAQIFVSSTYSKYSKIANKNGMSGAEAARFILDKNGLNDVKVGCSNGYLSDHYDPRKRVVNLSDANYRGASIGALAVACHECGHAIQHKVGYTFMKIRSSLVPFVNFSSYAGYIAIVLGCFLGEFNLVFIGILAECVILLFQIITLPVEIDASKRALKELEKYRLLDDKELKGGKSTLIAAALTYVASVITALLQILRLVLMFSGKNDN